MKDQTSLLSLLGGTPVDRARLRGAAEEEDLIYLFHLRYV